MYKSIKAWKRFIFKVCMSINYLSSKDPTHFVSAWVIDLGMFSDWKEASPEQWLIWRCKMKLSLRVVVVNQLDGVNEWLNDAITPDVI